MRVASVSKHQIQDAFSLGIGTGDQAFENHFVSRFGRNHVQGSEITEHDANLAPRSGLSGKINGHLLDENPERPLSLDRGGAFPLYPDILHGTRLEYDLRGIDNEKPIRWKVRFLPVLVNLPGKDPDPYWHVFPPSFSSLKLRTAPGRRG
jgi:hypothetical protein